MESSESSSSQEPYEKIIKNHFFIREENQFQLLKAFWSKNKKYVLWIQQVHYYNRILNDVVNMIGLCVMT